MTVSSQVPQIQPSHPNSIETAFPIAWYAIVPSHSIQSSPVGIRRLGLDLVLWRDAEGRVVCQSRYCPHRGVDLALGQISNQTGQSCLECPYHGFQFASDGDCVLMPCEGESGRIPPQMRVESYRVRECHGFIWLWWGDDAAAAPEIPWFAELEDLPRHWADGEMVWDVHFTRAVESALIDIHHFAFAHRRVAKWFGFGDAKYLDALETQVVGDRIQTRGTLKSDRLDGVSFGFENQIRFPNLSIFNFGLGGTKLFATFTPIDGERTWINFRYYASFRWAFLSRAIAKIAVWFELNFVQPDDYRLLESTVPKRSSLTVNRFVRADRTIVHWHKLNQHHPQKEI